MRRVLQAALALLALSGAPAHADQPGLILTPLAGGPPESLARMRHGGPALILFWRADCVPCLLELEHLPELRAAAAGTPFLLVGLQPADRLQAGLARLHARGPAWVAAEEWAAVLTRFGGPPPRLPLAVAIFPDGAICKVRHGLVGRATIRQWVIACD